MKLCMFILKRIFSWTNFRFLTYHKWSADRSLVKVLLSSIRDFDFVRKGTAAIKPARVCVCVIFGYIFASFFRHLVCGGNITTPRGVFLRLERIFVKRLNAAQRTVQRFQLHLSFSFRLSFAGDEKQQPLLERTKPF